MKAAPIGPDDEARVGRLRDYGLLDTEPELQFDAIAKLAAMILAVPIALISLVDADRQWFKARFGLDALQTPRDVSFCGHAVASDSALVVRDAFADERFADNPLVLGDPKVRFYAGVPIHAYDGHAIGTLCAIDHEPRELAPTQLEALRLLAIQVEALVELHRTNRLVREREQRMQTVFDAMVEGVVVQDRAGSIIQHNHAAEQILGLTTTELEHYAPGQSGRRVIHTDGSSVQPDEYPAARTLATGRSYDDVILGVQYADRMTWLSLTSRPLSHPGATHPHAAVVTLRDVTEARTAADRLEALVQARTSSLAETNRQLEIEVAERQRAERGLVAREAKYRELYDESPDMHVTVEMATEAIIDCNLTLCHRLGYERQALLGRPYHSLYALAYAAQRGDRKLAFERSGEIVDVEQQLICADGTAIDVSLNVVAVRDGDSIVAARAVWRDNTKRKEADLDRQFILEIGEAIRSSVATEEVMATANRMLATHLGAARCFFAVVDASTDTVTLLPGHAAGLPPLEGPMPLSAFGGVVAADAARGVPVVVTDASTDPRTARVYDTAWGPASLHSVIAVPLGTGSASYLVLAEDRARLWAEREVMLVKLVAERAWTWIDHVRLTNELHERAIADAVAHTEARFRSLVEGVKDYAIFMLDTEGRATTWNVGIARLKGYSAEEVIGKHFSQFFTEEDRQRDHARTMLAAALADGHYEEEGWRVRKDGSRFWANVLITPLYTSSGTHDGFAKVTRDFTEHRRHEQEITHKQLALEQSLKEREVLLQEVHHRVKNNLQVISSLINMQVRKLERGPTRDALSECQLRVLAIALIHETLYQSKDYARVRFAEYARGLAANVFRAAGSRDDITLELAIEDVPLGVDRAIPCGLILNELITNALKHGFGDRSKGTIKVTLKRVGETNLSLVVADDGAGLVPGFDVTKAASMGLQLVSTLAMQLDGTLRFDGTAGTTVELVFGS